MQTPTPFNKQKFRCLSLTGNCKDCLSKPFDIETAVISLVGKDFPDHPYAGWWLCQPCRTSNAFYTKTMKALAAMDDAEMSAAQKRYSEYLQRRKLRRNETSRNDYWNRRKDSPEECLQVIETGHKRKATPQVRQEQSAKTSGTQTKAGSINEYSISTEVQYPPDLLQLMDKALVLYLQQCGEPSLLSKIINGMLKAVLIEYNNRKPHRPVIEYYVEKSGKNKPIYYKKQFDKVIQNRMYKQDTRGVRGRGRLWFPFDKVTPNQLEEAKAERTRNNWLQQLHPDLVARIVQQVFSEVNIEQEPPDFMTLKLSECAMTNNKSRTNENWKKYEHRTGINLSYY